MAICHLTVKAVSRAAGRSSVASAAYRAGETLTNERDGVTHRYEKRRGVEMAVIVTPSGCEWARDRSCLWNAAEAAEKRKDAKTAREYVLALPHELDGAQRKALAMQFAESVVERFGVAADVAIHAPGAEGDQRNHHVHILTTTRVVEPGGLGAKTRQLDVSTSAAKEIEALRELWAMQCNEALERAGQEARLDPRGYAEQGLERVPGVHLGPTATAIERRELAAAEREGRAYQPRTQEGRQNAAAAEKNRLLAVAKAMIEEAGEVIRAGVEKVEATVKRARGLARMIGGKDRQEREAQAERERRARMERHEQERRAREAQLATEKAVAEQRERAVRRAAEPPDRPRPRGRGR